jgi:hypothetical protein
MSSSSVNSTQRLENSAELSEGSGNSPGNSYVVLATYRGFLQFGSDTGSRDSRPHDFAEKTGFSLTFSNVQLTNSQVSQNFDRLFFAQLKGEFNPHFCGFFGTNWDKSARGYDPRWHGKPQKLTATHKPKTLTSRLPSCLIFAGASA